MLKVVLVALGLCLLEMGVIVMASPLAKPALVLRFLPEDVRWTSCEGKRRLGRFR